MTTGGGHIDPLDTAKTRWRTSLLAARRALPPDVLAAARAEVAAHVLAGLRPTDRIVAAYSPWRTEPGSTELLAALVASGRSVIVPVTLPDRDLSWTPWTPGGPVDGSLDGSGDLGRDAVARADLVLVPALAVGPHGERLGRGGGSYDRALPRTRARLVALLHRGELLADVPVVEHDVPVDAAVTPDGWFDRHRTG